MDNCVPLVAVAILAGLLLTSTADAGCRQADDESAMEFYDAVDCATLGSKVIADDPVPGSPTLQQAEDKCRRLIPKLRQSGFTKRDLDFLIEHTLDDNEHLIFVCDENIWRLRVQFGMSALLRSDWMVLPGGKIEECSTFGTAKLYC
jgi:hypothetical protein